MLEMLTPKKIILDQLESRFKKLDLISVMLTYSISEKNSKCKGLKSDNTTLDIEVTKGENSLISKMLISKVNKAIDFEFLECIIKIDILKKDISLYVRKLNSELVKIKV